MEQIAPFDALSDLARTQVPRDDADLGGQLDARIRGGDEADERDLRARCIGARHLDRRTDAGNGQAGGTQRDAGPLAAVRGDQAYLARLEAKGQRLASQLEGLSE